MSKAEQTRQFIIEKTAPIFNKKGFAGTSLSDMTNATGLTKGSIYGNFENKEEVTLAVYEHNTGQLWKNKNACIAKHKNAYAQLIALVDFYRNSWKGILENGGCPILNAAAESDDTMPILKARVKLSMGNWKKDISKIIELGIEQKTFNKGINTNEYAILFIMMIEGGILLSKIADKPDSLNLALDRIVKIIDEEIVK
ncbi:MAG: TetR/AcrR family transcriptional regulator [Chitinophagaceae bacterium]|jgi:AcrR family transcriptional regulator